MEEMDREFKNLVVLGASAGGIKALQKSLQGIPASIDAAFVAVVHVSEHSDCEAIASLLQRKTFLSCKVASQGDRLRSGRLYLAPSGCQLLVDGGGLVLSPGAYENRFRPSIDALFRSAAVAFANRTIGIVLTGLLNDGTSGMWAVKACGGRCIVQEPSEADFADMPNNVLAKVEADHVVRLDELPALIARLNREPLPEPVTVPEALRAEVGITKNGVTSIEAMRRLGQRSGYSCPDCGGSLWSLAEGSNIRYRCHTGHSYSEELLDELQDKTLLESLVVAIRMMEEKLDFLEKIAARAPEASARRQYSVRRLEAVSEHIAQLKRLMVALHGPPPAGSY